MTSKIGVSIALVVGIGALQACRYSEAKEPQAQDMKTDAPAMTSSDSAPPPSDSESSSELATAPPPPTGACDDRACVASEDCCKGFACGFDPERSRVQRYCLSAQ